MTAAFAAAMLWGYWRAQTHASLDIRVRDAGLRTPNLAYGDPHNVRIRFFDASNRHLAAAHSIEPIGYILAIHPDPAVGDCRAYEGRPPGASINRATFSECYAAASKWFSAWAPQVASAEIAVGRCVLRPVPVQVETYAADWWLWWVPLPHSGGTPRRHITLTATIDSKRCAMAR